MMNLTINFDALMEDVKGIRHAYAFRMTDVMKQNGIEEHQKGVVAVENGKVYRSCLVRVTGCEDKGDYYYVGYRPMDTSFGAFGYTRLYKNGQHEYGTLGFERVNVDGKPY